MWNLLQHPITGNVIAAVGLYLALWRSLNAKIDLVEKRLNDRMDERFGYFDGRFVALEKSLDERFGYFDGRFVALEKSLDERFGHFDKRLNAMDKRIDDKYESLQQLILKVESGLQRQIDMLHRDMIGIIPAILQVANANQERRPPEV